ncbi:MAG: barstar family protein [Lachnospiraceae bacterium]|nr:barstar family protein [Lachnospiraceae bacterium]
MRKILLNLHVPKTEEQVQRYLALEFDFPDYYGENLDALYDMLTGMTEDTCVGFFEPEEETELSRYLSRVKRVFQDAEEENPHLCVIFSDLEDNSP